jgi:hypothetical protein
MHYALSGKQSDRLHSLQVKQFLVLASMDYASCDGTSHSQQAGSPEPDSTIPALAVNVVKMTNVDT